MNTTRLTLLTSRVFLVLALAWPVRGWAGVLPPNAVVDGATTAEWSAECWKWVWSHPIAQSAMLETTGRWATNQQPAGIVFLFAPVNLFLTPPPVTRSFVVPENKFLLVPVLVLTADNIFTVPPLTVPDLLNILDSVVAAPVELHASVDGVDIPNLLQHRTTAPPFSMNFPNEDHALSVNYGYPIVGLVDPILVDGYWLMLEPLAPGAHTIRAGGTDPLPDFIHPQDITSEITVEAVPPSRWVEDFLVVVSRADLAAKPRRKLVEHLEKARTFFERGKTAGGIRELRSFQTEMQRLSESAPGLASDFISYTDRIITRARRPSP